MFRPWRCLRTRRCLQYSTKSRPSPSPPSAQRIIFSGIQPTGVPHIGNYLGALKDWVSFQHSVPENVEIIYSIVDLHAMTIPYKPDTLIKNREEIWAVLYAIGIDMRRCIVFEQSAVPEHAELNWILTTLASMGQLNRMTQWKAKLEETRLKGLVRGPQDKDTDFGGAKLGLFAYPVLQAADILLYNATHVPVGEDQSQHLETARVLAKQFNSTYRTKTPTFNLPETLISTFPRIASLTNPTKKMSKSDENTHSRILLTTPRDEIRQSIMSAVTDSEDGIFASETRPAITNLLYILAGFEGKSVAEVEGQVKHLSKKDFKERVAESIVSKLRGIQLRYSGIINNKNWLTVMRMEGNSRARELASKRMKEIKKVCGLVY